MLSIPVDINPSFDPIPETSKPLDHTLVGSKRKGKYFNNPQPNWGPKARATGNKTNQQP